MKFATFLLIGTLAAPALGVAPANAQPPAARLAAAQAAATITVDTLTDNYDLTDNKCSIREALMRAASNDQNNVNTNDCAQSASGNTEIKFAVAGTIVISNGVGLGVLPYITNRVTLKGPITLDMSKLDGQGLVEGSSSAKFSLIDVTIKNAKWTGLVNDAGGELNIVRGKFENNSAGGAGGGAIRTYGPTTIAGTEFINNKAVKKSSGEGTKDGGAIRSTWKLVISTVKFQGNVADGQGGAIMAQAHSFDIADSTFIGNVTQGLPHDLDHTGDGGAYGSGGGAISFAASGNTYPSFVRRSTFQGNTALEGSGGAIFHNGGALLTLEDSNFIGNHVGSGAKKGAGGAVFNVGSEMLIKRGMFTGNSATGDGGAVANETSGNMKIRMTGFAGNNASGKGGAILNSNLTGSDALIDGIGLQVTGNVAGGGGGGIYNYDAKYDVASFRMTVFAGNLPENCKDKSLLDDVLAPDGTPDDDQIWPIDSKGQNYFSDPSCESDDEEDDKDPSDPGFNPDPALLPPAANGGPPGMLTMSPAITSPLVDAGGQTRPNDPDVQEDVRGQKVALDGNGDGIIAFDIGSFEKDDARPKFSSLPVKGGSINVGSGGVNVAFTKTAALKIFNGGDLQLNLSNVQKTGAHAADFTLTVPGSVAPGASASVNISCKPAAAGDRTASLSFSTNDPDNPTAGYTLTCKGTVGNFPVLDTNPPPGGVATRKTKAGQAADASISFSNKGNATLTYGSVSFVADPPGGIVSSGSPVPPSQAAGSIASNQIYFCDVSTPGIKTAKLSFVTNEAGNPTRSYDIVCDVEKAPDPVFSTTNERDIANIGLNGAPYGIAVSPDGRDAYLTTAGTNYVLHYNVTEQYSLTYRQRIFNTDLDATERFTTPQQVKVSRDGLNVYVTGSGADSIAMFDRDPETGNLTHVNTLREGSFTSCALVGGFPACSGSLAGLNGAHGIVESPDGKQLYVSAHGSNAIVVFSRNPDTGAIHRRLCQIFTNNCRTYANVAMVYTHASLTAPYGMALSPDGLHLYVPGYLSNNIQALKRNPETGAISHVQTVGSGVAACLSGAYRAVVSPDGAYVYTTGISNKICVFKRNPVDGTLIAQPDVSPSNFAFGTDIALSPDATILFASARDSASIVAYDRDAATGALSWRDTITGPTGIPELAGARGIALHPSGKAMYATSNFSDSVASLWLAKPKPMIEAVTPASIAAGSSATQITFHGRGFQPDTFALYGLFQLLPTQFVNSNKVIATLPASALAAPAEIPIYLNTPAPGGGFTSIFTAYVQSAGAIPVPVIESVSLQGALAGASTAAIEVKGSGFSSGAVVLANGAARTTQFISSTLLRATLVADDFADIGTLVISIDNTPTLARGESASVAPSSSNKVGLTIAPPNENAPASALSMTPARSFAQIRRSGFNVAVKGNFVPGAQAYWNGEPRMTRYIDANTVSVSVGAADVVVPNSFAAVTVVNPAPGGGESQALTFEIVGPEPYFVLLPTVRR